MAGIGIGFVVMVVLVGLGLAQIFEAFPISHMILKVLSVCYMLYLAWKIAGAAPPSETEETGTPLTFLQAALFQWVNPKAWAMALTAVTVYAPTRSYEIVLLVALIFGAINLPSVSVWTLIGLQMRRFLTNRKRLRIFNLTMAFLLIVSLYPVLI